MSYTRDTHAIPDVTDTETDTEGFKVVKRRMGLRADRHIRAARRTGELFEAFIGDQARSNRRRRTCLQRLPAGSKS